MLQLLVGGVAGYKQTMSVPWRDPNWGVEQGKSVNTQDAC